MGDAPASINTGAALMQAGQHGSLQAAAKLEAARQEKNLQAIEEAAQEFEAVFIAEMMKPMFANLSTEPPFGGGKAEEVFRSVMLQEYGKEMAATGRLGIADHVKEAMLKAQEQMTHETVQ